MKYSLLTINDDGKTGYWMQDHIGTIESAKETAKMIESVNSNKITVGVFNDVATVVPFLQLFQLNMVEGIS